MAFSSLLTLKRVFTHLRSSSTTRRPFSSSPFGDMVRNHVDKNIAPAIIALDTSFSAPDNHHSRRRAAGFFIYPKIIVTSAHAIAHLSTFYHSTTLAKPDRFHYGHGSIKHKAYIGTTIASTDDGRVLETTPLAVNFANDVAVLMVVTNTADNLPHYLGLGNPLGPGKEIVVMAFASQRLRLQIKFLANLGNYPPAREMTVGAKAPWPLDRGLGWVEYDWFMSDVGNGLPPPQTISFNCPEKPTGSIAKFSGSPWFNLRGEVIGISSWELRDECPFFFVGFAVPPLSIRSVVDYAIKKRAEDPVIMDEWIE